jgi:CheY-like chemotaxis protein
MATDHRILLLDDEQDLLELYSDLLKRLPAKPEVHTADSGQRALSMLKDTAYTVLITDLNMPKMDGLALLSVVRPKYPGLRVVVMTSVMDEQYRTRAYALGVDLFWEKPGTQPEIETFMEAVQAVLDRQEQSGFSGVQKKSLVDIIQFECQSLSSMTLKITNGSVEGRIWIVNGDIIDAAIGEDFNGMDAFKRILTWKRGSFESLPAEPERERHIQGSYQGLLLDSAQEIDEASSGGSKEIPLGEDGQPIRLTPMQAISKIEGVEFAVTVPADAKTAPESWGMDNAGAYAIWARKTLEGFTSLGKTFVVGEIKEIEGRGRTRHATVSAHGGKPICVGMQRALSAEETRDTMKKVLAKWVS